MMPIQESNVRLSPLHPRLEITEKPISRCLMPMRCYIKRCFNILFTSLLNVTVAKTPYAPIHLLLQEYELLPIST